MSYDFTPQEVRAQIEDGGLYEFLSWGFDTRMLVADDPELVLALKEAKEYQLGLDRIEQRIEELLNTYEEETND